MRLGADIIREAARKDAKLLMRVIGEDTGRTAARQRDLEQQWAGLLQEQLNGPNARSFLQELEGIGVTEDDIVAYLAKQVKVEDE